MMYNINVYTVSLYIITIAQYTNRFLWNCNIDSIIRIVVNVNR